MERARFLKGKIRQNESIEKSILACRAKLKNRIERLGKHVTGQSDADASVPLPALALLQPILRMPHS